VGAAARPARSGGAGGLQAWADAPPPRQLQQERAATARSCRSPHPHQPHARPCPPTPAPTPHTQRDALRVISLREDFKTAKVDGKSLGRLFSGAVEGVMSIRV
jgi:hypothetical protein